MTRAKFKTLAVAIFSGWLAVEVVLASKIFFPLGTDHTAEVGPFGTFVFVSVWWGLIYFADFCLFGLVYCYFISKHRTWTKRLMFAIAGALTMAIGALLIAVTNYPEWNWRELWMSSALAWISGFVALATFTVLTARYEQSAPLS